ncbi:tail tube [Pseudomonas phage PspYZU05]|uniref:Baseplate tail tube initiator n=1 Tax=Pseudomonas phage PspYZU05 TaxID=1983556 RepID=A0A2U7NN34_9CAUD|nr:tail tube [Pseudomonas phage PspYZU05]ASD52107.1 baseplate tail tube initiator [Pseudomonas phage PspYZU05]
MINLEEFRSQAANLDFQRTNMFSVLFATAPNRKAGNLLNTIGGTVYENLTGEKLAGQDSRFMDGVTQLINIGTEKLIRKSKVSKYLIGAMSSRVVQTLLGEIEVGTYLLDYFNENFNTSGLSIYSVKLPENRLSYEMDKNHNSPNIRITGREYDPLVLSFRMDSGAANYRAMQDWVNAVEDPKTGLRAFPIDVEADIQVSLHARSGLPHTVVILEGCIPISVSAPNLSWEDNNQITTFDVTFAYRLMSTGAIGTQAASEWLESAILKNLQSGSIAGGFSVPNTISRLYGNGRVSNGLNPIGGIITSVNRLI